MVQKTMYIEEEVEGRKKAEYESRLADELRAIRDQTANELEDYKIQIEETFEVSLWAPLSKKLPRCALIYQIHEVCYSMTLSSFMDLLLIGQTTKGC